MRFFTAVSERSWKVQSGKQANKKVENGPGNEVEKIKLAQGLMFALASRLFVML